MLGMSIPGSNIAMLRRQLGISQRSLSKQASVDLSTLSKLESGKGGYSPDGIERIAKVLNVSIGILFAEPGIVEAAALGMREVPILSPEQLHAWNGFGEAVYRDKQEFLHVALSVVSHNAFALVVTDDANTPEFCRGDELIFDAGRQPSEGVYVAAQGTEPSVFIGRLRFLPSRKTDSQSFVVIPTNYGYPLVESTQVIGLRLRGVLAQFRKTIPR